MISISAKEFVKQTVKPNPTEDATSLIAACHENVTTQTVLMKKELQYI